MSRTCYNFNKKLAGRQVDLYPASMKSKGISLNFKRMAILKNGANGGFSGKVGSIVGYELSGQDVIRGLT